MFGSGWAGSAQTPWRVHEREGKMEGGREVAWTGTVKIYHRSPALFTVLHWIQLVPYVAYKHTVSWNGTIMDGRVAVCQVSTFCQTNMMMMKGHDVKWQCGVCDRQTDRQHSAYRLLQLEAHHITWRSLADKTWHVRRDETTGIIHTTELYAACRRQPWLKIHDNITVMTYDMTWPVDHRQRHPIHTHWGC